LSSSKQTVNVSDKSFSNKHFKLLFGDESINNSSFSLNAYEACVWSED